jgi:TIGR03009 family protein
MTPRCYCQLLAAVALGGTPTLFASAQEPLPSVQETQTVQIAPTELSGQQLAQVTPALDQIGPPHAAAAPQGPVGAPFQLSPVEQQFVDQILQQWENQSATVKTFDCKFERWEYDPVFGPGDETPMIKSKGQLTYSKPDKGSFKIDEIFRYIQKDQSQPGDYVLQEHEVGEHWVCDGKAVYEYKHDKKQLVVQPLPEDMRGKSIVDGPLPFLFGAEADKLKDRYWIRTKQSDDATIWLEAYPRTQADAANYHHVEVMLDRKTMMPNAIQVHMPNGRSRAVYMFQDPKVNGTLNQLFGAMFSSPRTPLGWTRVVQETPEETPPGSQAANPQDLQQR